MAPPSGAEYALQMRRFTALPVAITIDRSLAERISVTAGGEGGIRTHGAREGTPVFKTGAFNRSATSPCAGQDFKAIRSTPPM